MPNPATLSGHIQIGQDMGTPVTIHATYSVYDQDIMETVSFEAEVQTDSEGLYSLPMHRTASATVVFTHPSFSVSMGIVVTHTEETLIINQDDIRTSVSVTSTGWNARSYYLIDKTQGFLQETTLVGNQYTELLVGSNQDNDLSGQGRDTIYGMDGNDTIRLNGTGSTGYGGKGSDTYYAGSDDTLVEYENEGTDTVITNGNYTLSEHIEILRFANFWGGTGTGNAQNNTMYSGSFQSNHLLGMAGNDTLFGGRGRDTLDGGTGDDHLYGGDGDHTYIVDSAQDLVVEEENSGVDSVYATYWDTTMTLYEHVENLVLMGIEDLPGTGNGLANALTGNTGNNLLDGLDGNDGLWGMDGQDKLMGGRGADRLYGGNGDDSLHGSVGQDKLFGGAGNDSLYGEGSNDRLNSGLGDDYLVGGTGLDTLDAGAGNDVLDGGEGSDELWGATGRDTLLGGNGNDTLHGGNWADFLYGGDGDDILHGGQSNDTLFGGTGTDRFSFEAGDGKDTVVDFARSDGDLLAFAATAFSPGTTIDDIIALHTTVMNGITTIVFEGGSVRIEGVTDLAVGDLMWA